MMSITATTTVATTSATASAYHMSAARPQIARANDDKPRAVTLSGADERYQFNGTGLPRIGQVVGRQLKRL